MSSRIRLFLNNIEAILKAVVTRTLDKSDHSEDAGDVAVKKWTWSLADVLDLEFFFIRDQDIKEQDNKETPAERDRRIYLAVKDFCPPEDENGRRSCLLRRWLSARRTEFLQQKNDDNILPGRLFDELMRISSRVFFLLSFIGGWGAALSYLHYAGKTPVNVATFLAIFVVSQLLVLTILLFFLAAGRLRTKPPLPLTYGLVRKMVFFLAAKISRLAPQAGPGRHLAAISANIHRYSELYGPIFILPFFLLVQLAAIGFNLGVEVALLLKVVATDVAFGWQSTLAAGAEGVFHLVRLIALPWSWALPAGIGYPTLEQIQGSRMVLKEGIYHLSTGALASWWPFLCLCVAFYGLLPRLILYISGRMAMTRLLDRLPFNAAAHRQLLHAMTTPRLATAAAVEQKSVEQKGEHEQPPAEPESEPAPAVTADGGGQALVLIGDEIFSDCPRKEFAELARQRTGVQPVNFFAIDDSGHERKDFYDEIRQTMGPNIDTILILQEAWQPPIEEFFAFLDDLRQVIGKKILITILLIGKPAPHTILTEARDRDYTIWQEKITRKGDPYLQCLSLLNPQ